jgi:hypothetical protein
MTTTLREGSAWVTLKPLHENTAKVEDGNAWRRGDLVSLPPGISWEDAGFPGPDGGTRVGPFDLELVYDAITGFSPGGSLGDPEEILSVEDDDARWAFLEVELRLDDAEALARAFSEEMGRGEPARPDSSDLAA